MEKEFIISEESAGLRLDKFLGKAFDSVSRTKVSKLIDEAKVTVDGQNKKASFHLLSGQKVVIDIPEEIPFEMVPFAQDIPIIYEDDELMVIEKPGGISTHPPHAGVNNTLVNALVYMNKTLAPINPLRPGVVHRLDRETSGVMVVAKTNRAYLHLMNQFRRRVTKKEYRAIVWGRMEKDDVTVDLPIARDENNRLRMKISFIESKNAFTEAKVIERFSDSTYLSLNIRTGRMHQIRVHMKFLGLPIVGDPKYGKNDSYKELFLHAYKLGFYHPITDEFKEFVSPLPSRFQDFLASRRKI